MLYSGIETLLGGSPPLYSTCRKGFPINSRCRIRYAVPLQSGKPVDHFDTMHFFKKLNAATVGDAIFLKIEKCILRICNMLTYNIYRDMLKVIPFILAIRHTNPDVPNNYQPLCRSKTAEDVRIRLIQVDRNCIRIVFSTLKLCPF